MVLPSSILSLRLLQFSATQTLNPLMLPLIYRNVTLWWWGKNCVTKGRRFSVPYFLCVHCPNWDARYCDGSVEKVSKFWMYPASHLKHVGILPLVCMHVFMHSVLIHTHLINYLFCCSRFWVQISSAGYAPLQNILILAFASGLPMIILLVHQHLKEVDWLLIFWHCTGNIRNFF